MNIRSKLLIGFGTILLVMGVVAIVNFKVLINVNNTFTKITDQTFLLEKHVRNGRLMIVRIHSGIINAMLFGYGDKSAQIKKLDGYTLKFYTVLDSIEQIHFEERKNINALRKQFEAYYILSKRILEKPEKIFSAKNNDLMEKYLVYRNNLLKLIDKIFNNYESHYEFVLHQLKTEIYKLTGILVIMLAVGITIAFIVAYRISSSIIVPINKLVTAVEEFQNGNFDISVDLDSSDETGKLAATFNSMVADLNTSFSKLKGEIDERKNYQEALQKSEEEYRHLVENIPGVVYKCLIDDKRTLLFISETIREISGYNPQDFFNNNAISLVDLLHPEDLRKIKEKIPRKTTSEEVFDFEYRIKNRDGNFHVVYERGQVFYDSNIDNYVYIAVFIDITELRNTQNALREKQGMFKAIFNQTFQGIALIKVDGTIVELNNTYEEMWGLEPSRYIGQYFWELPLWQKAEGTEKRIKEAVKEAKEGKLVRFDIEVSDAGGEKQYLDFSLKPIVVENREVEFLIPEVRDITEIKQAESRLVESEEKFRTISEQSIMGIAIIQDGKIIYANSAFLQHGGYSMEELNQWGADEFNEKFFYREDLPAIREKINAWKKLGSNAVLNFEFRSRTRNRGERWVELFSKTIQYKNKPAILSVFSDITERKQMEIELESTRSYVKNIVDSMPSILIGINTDGKIIQWNRETERRTGLSEADVLNKSVFEVYPDKIFSKEKIQQTILNKKVYSEEKIAVSHNDEIKYYDLTVYPLTMVGDEGAVIRIDDVTRQARIDELLLQNEKMMTVGGLAAGMAHEINNPLAGILQNTQVVINRLSKDIPVNLKAAEESGISMEAMRKYLKKRDILHMLQWIHSSGMEASKIIKNMLNFSRKSESRFEQNDMKIIIDKVLELAANDYNLKKSYDFRKIEIVKEYYVENSVIWCDSTQIQQVLINLVRNAAQAMMDKAAENGKENRPRLIFRLSDSDNLLRLELEDNGPGIDEKIRKRIFEPFFTTKKVGEGTGLGLSVSYFIITENHGGHMEVNSKIGYGTTFIIELPMKV